LNRLIAFSIALIKIGSIKSWFFIIPFLATLSLAAQTYPPKDWQIKTAVLAAPEHERENATVMGYTSDGELTTQREGSNDLICPADDPARKGFSVACYHDSLESFMARGRALHGLWMRAHAGPIS